MFKGLFIKEEREQGFNLIELLVVILIIGILAAIAIPFFFGQKKSAIDASVVSDVRNAAGTIGTWVGKQGTAETPIPADWTTDFQNSKAADAGKYKDIQVMLSSGTIMRITGTSYHYVITANNPNGEQSNPANGGVAYDSTVGIIKSGTAAGSGTPANPVADPKSVNCGGGTYMVSGTGTSISCNVSAPTGSTTLYSLTVSTTSATPIQWSVNADWSKVQGFNSLDAWNVGGAIASLHGFTATTYTFSGVDRSWNNDPASAINYQYISSTKGSTVISINITAGK